MRSSPMADSLAFMDTGVLSLNPLVTYSKRHVPTPIGLAGACPELFSGQRSLHFVSLAWSLHPGDLVEIASEHRRVSQLLPDALVVVLANTDADVFRLTRAGALSILGNSAIFIDEQTFKPQPAFDFSDAAYDAIYNARFEPYKRHALARSIDRLALIYDAPFKGGVSPHEAAVRKALPRARFLNDEYGDGRYSSLTKNLVAREVNRARCGLCLSEDEGATRASMEYLMCGVPVVSTRSQGGRDRHYLPSMAIVVRDEPEAIREAVAEFGRRRLDKLAIRNQIGSIVEFERSNFLAIINALAREHLGVPRLFETVAPFVRAHPFTAPKEEWSRRKLIKVADALGRTLAPIDSSADAEKQSVA